MLSLYLILGIFILLLTIFFQKRHKGEPEPPYLSGYIPLIGHSYRFIGNSEHMFDLIQEWTDKIIKGGDTLRIALGTHTFYAVGDPDDALTVATTCLTRNSLYEFSRPWLGDGLISCTDETKWKTHRKLLNYAFNQQILDGFLPLFNNIGRHMVHHFGIDGRDGPFYSDKLVLRCALESIYQAATGLDLSADIEANDKFVNSTDEAFHTIIMRVQNIFYHNDFLWNRSGVKSRHDKAIQYTQSVVNKILEMRKQRKKSTEVTTASETAPKSFSDMFFDIHEDKGIFTEKDVLDHVITLIVGGYDTVANSYLLILVMIGSYPEVQEKIYAELQKVFGETDRDVERQDLSQLVYMEAVIKEVLRLYPVGPLVVRTIDKEVRLKTYTLKPGRSCFIAINVINRHPKWWDDPEEFKPERWLNPDTQPRNPNLFSTFSLGRRSCIGRTYAIMWIKTCLSHLLRKYQISADINKVKLKYDVLTKISSGHYIGIKSRA